jgi:hypothetical protein
MNHAELLPQEYTEDLGSELTLSQEAVDEKFAEIVEDLEGDAAAQPEQNEVLEQVDFLYKRGGFREFGRGKQGGM